jgi:hypothetical protein
MKSKWQQWQQMAVRLGIIGLGVLPLAFLKWQQSGNSGNISHRIFIDKVHSNNRITSSFAVLRIA